MLNRAMAGTLRMRVAVVVMDGFTLAKFVHLINQKSRQQAINTEAPGAVPEANGLCQLIDGEEFFSVPVAVRCIPH